MNRETTPRAPLDFSQLPRLDLSHAAIVVDDGAAKEFLAAEGMLGRLEPEPPYTSAALTWRSANTNAINYAANFRGCGDDGYFIVSLDGEYYSTEEASKMIAVFMAVTNARPGAESHALIDPDAN